MCLCACMRVFSRHRDGLLAPFMPEVHPDAVLILEDDAELKPRFLECARAAMLQAGAAETAKKKKTYGMHKNWDIIYLGHILPNQIMAGISYAASSKATAAAEGGDGDEASPDGPVLGTLPGSSSPRAAAATTTADTTATTTATTAAATAAAEAESLGLKIAPVTFAWCLHAYLLTREGAERLATRVPVTAPADIFVASFLSATDNRRPVLAGRAVLPAIATAGPAGGDVVSSGTLRAGAADGIWHHGGKGGGGKGRGRGKRAAGEG
ncbi:unnamed protein product [Laminaria digitata]